MVNRNAALSLIDENDADDVINAMAMNDKERRCRSGCSCVEVSGDKSADCTGKLATMPPKMMIEMPLPMPVLGDQLTHPDQQHRAGGHREQESPATE